MTTLPAYLDKLTSQRASIMTDVSNCDARLATIDDEVGPLEERLELLREKAAAEMANRNTHLMRLEVIDFALDQAKGLGEGKADKPAEIKPQTVRRPRRTRAQIAADTLKAAQDGGLIPTPPPAPQAGEPTATPAFTATAAE